MLDPDGDYLSEVNVGQGVIVIARGCGDDLVVHGPVLQSAEERRPWLIACETTDDSLLVDRPTVLLRDTASRASRGFGKSVISSDGRNITIQDEYSVPRSHVLLDCSARTAPPVVVPVPEMNAVPRANMRIRSGDRIFGGLAVTDGRIVWVLSVMPTRIDDRY